jgi:hypothetical protein
MMLNFSAHPGPRERQLQRKLNNPLFLARDTLTQQAIVTAQIQDQQALQQFMENFRELVQQAVTLDKNVESDVILLLKAKLEQHYAVCTGLAGETAPLKTALKKLIAAINASLRAAATQDGSDALEKIDHDEAHTALHLQLCDHLIVSDILNPDQIITPAEQIPVLLNESPEGLQAALALYPPDRLTQMVEEAVVLLKKIEMEGHNLPAAWQRLAQIEHWLQSASLT